MCSPSSRSAGRCRHTATVCGLPAMPATGAQEAGCPGAGGWDCAGCLQCKSVPAVCYATPCTSATAGRRWLLRTGSGRAHQAATHCCLRGTPDAVEQPTLCCVPNARDFVQSFGLEFFPLGGDPQVRLRRSKASHQHRRQKRRFGFAGRALRYQVQTSRQPRADCFACREAAAMAHTLI